MAKKKSHKDLLREAFLGKIKFYDASIVLPPLLEVNPLKRRYQLQSKRCLVWFTWADAKNGTIPDLKFATRFKMGFVIEGVTGNTKVISWAYVPIKPITP